MRVYSFDGVSWAQVGQDIDGEAANDNSGYSVAMSSDGNTVVIGAHLVSQLTFDIMTQEARILCGSSFCTMYILVGLIDLTFFTHFQNDGGSADSPDSGHVRVYSFDGVSWVQVGQDIDGEDDDDRSGYSVAMSSDGKTVAIGAPFVS